MVPGILLAEDMEQYEQQDSMWDSLLYLENMMEGTVASACQFWQTFYLWQSFQGVIHQEQTQAKGSDPHL